MDVDNVNQISSFMSSMSVDNYQHEVVIHPSATSDNGLFDLLPSELLLSILDYLSVDELATLSMVSTLFYEHCYNPLLHLHQHLNLQPFWFRIGEQSLEGFVKKCTKIQSLNLSWCGSDSNHITSAPPLFELIKAETLTRLDLACCSLTDDSFKRIILSCRGLKELDVSSTQRSLTSSSLQIISTLCNLTRYKTG